MHPLDDPVRSALTGTHAPFALRHGSALRYPPEMSVWGVFPDDADGWRDAEEFGVVATAGDPRTAPAGWERTMLIPGVQYDGSGMVVTPDPEAVVLGPDDVPEMLDLVERTRPGPFAKRTIEMGTYLGIRHGGALVAMAGERMRPPGWSEISAVCTAPEARGRGLGSRLVRAVGAVIRERGDVPFLHASAANTGALRLYEHLGFTLRRTVEFAAYEHVAGRPVSHR
ncbi:GNAT family N-acetyltransferase [Pseudonocardia broussonetiae]|uniref:GNAT family N-acetyltransferase n=1 Tax=Pseudonocardia broussonetiae TaxID=2736640 RepID=A0A6M6JQA3_9PSEU|nr:GNAT family N-acetyltransferase [Pseudonocardia broussonetiae]QJY50078.1 GNAT family N-acetyltransferase [Pseudonocardia broussonetiae]